MPPPVLIVLDPPAGGKNTGGRESVCRRGSRRRLQLCTQHFSIPVPLIVPIALFIFGASSGVHARPAQQTAAEAMPEGMDIACGTGNPHEPSMARPWEERAANTWARNSDPELSNRAMPGSLGPSGASIALIYRTFCSTVKGCRTNGGVWSWARSRMRESGGGG